MKNGTLRFTEQEFAERAARRERFAAGKIHTLEKDVLSSVLEYLRKHPLVAWVARANTRCGYVLQHGVYDRLIRDGHIKKSEAQFMRFGFKGAADITGQLRDGRRLECECKSDSGKPSDDQVAFIDAVNGANGKAFIARSIDEAARALEAA